MTNLFNKGDRVRVGEYGFVRNVFRRGPQYMGSRTGVRCIDWSTRVGVVAHQPRSDWVRVIWGECKHAQAYHYDLLELANDSPAEC